MGTDTAKSFPIGEAHLRELPPELAEFASVTFGANRQITPDKPGALCHLGVAVRKVQQQSIGNSGIIEPAQRVLQGG